MFVEKILQKISKSINEGREAVMQIFECYLPLNLIEEEEEEEEEVT